ncbi:MAG: hypothetical protein D6759_11685 [Chloroflexi bacterium]|nr:MAG: hypothetical protein D6759_11685 [Chloroflexota bacterium]
MSAYEVVALLFLFVLFIPLVGLITVRLRRGWRPVLRPISAFRTLPGQVGRSAETGQTLHVALGSGGLGGSEAAASLAALSALRAFAEEGAATETPPLVTVGDATLLPVAQSVIQRAYQRQGAPTAFKMTQVQMVAPGALPYAAGTMHLLKRGHISANVMLGTFGLEAALITRGGAEAGLEQVAGTERLEGLATFYTSADDLLIGEELFAVGAYLRQQTADIASLVTQDLIRFLLVLVILAAALVKTLLG